MAGGIPIMPGSGGIPIIGGGGIPIIPGGGGIPIMPIIPGGGIPIIPGGGGIPIIPGGGGIPIIPGGGGIPIPGGPGGPGGPPTPVFVCPGPDANKVCGRFMAVTLRRVWFAASILSAGVPCLSPFASFLYAYSTETARLHRNWEGYTKSG
jgi:hypothetical protein